jgi:hypothetical protein
MTIAITCGKCGNTFKGYEAWAAHPCEQRPDREPSESTADKATDAQSGTAAAKEGP